MARVLVTGATGQIASYLVEDLLARGHVVLGTQGPDLLPVPAAVLDCGLLADPGGIESVLETCGTVDAVVHLAGRSSVGASWDDPLATFDANARLTMAVVTALARRPDTRLVHASSAEIFGCAATPVQDENTPIAPISPYGVSKAAAHLAVRFGREALGAPMSNLIFYLGESERRPPHYVFRKITRGIARIKLGLADHLVLGNTSAVRDFCHARDLAAAAASLALDGPPGDYVCASGEGHTIHDVVRASCSVFGLDPSRAVRTDPGLHRRADPPSLVGDSKRLRALGWAPSLHFEDLVETILRYDFAQLRGAAPGTA